MLRIALLIVGSLMTFAGLANVMSNNPNAWPLLIWGLILLVAVVFERWRYRPKTESGNFNQTDWQKTDEKFIDPETGVVMQVFYNAATGERKYVAAAD